MSNGLSCHAEFNTSTMYLKMDPENEAQPRSLFLLKSTSNSVKNKTGYILYGTSKYSTLEVF